MTTLALSRRSPSVGIPTNNIDSVMIPPSTPAPFLRPLNTSMNSNTSLYHICRSMLDRLSTIEGMTNYIEAENSTTDPLLKLTLICQKGYPLCTLYNALNPAKPINGDVDPTLKPLNSCKAHVYYFIVACKKELMFNEEDIFTISNLYHDDTNGFVKVVNTINKVLQLLEDRGIITVQSSNRNSDPNAPKNTRDKVVLELLETERKYVQDMEILQNYMRELQIQKIVSPDTIHYLFGNLNALVDFQRRFLVQLEEMAEKSPKEQRFGLLFIQHEQAFSVYEPYCVNYFAAQDLVVQETPRLQKLADILNPVYQLPSMLIKPIQRICKYPLLLNELVKSTDKDWAYYQESQVALESIKRVTEKVNETQRKQENLKAFQDLKKRLEDWKDLTLDGYGSLLLLDKLTTCTNPTENNSNDRDLHVFLFDKALLFCKESKGSNLLAKSNTLSINKKKRRGSLVPKMIFQTSSLSVINTCINKNGLWSLYLEFKDDNSPENILALRFRNEEQLKLWSSTLSRSIQNAMSENSDSTPTTSLTTANNTTQLASPYTDGEDDEDGEDEFLDDEEYDYIIKQRAHSDSFNHNIATIRSQEHQAGRPYQNVPGMNLSPLPRSYSSSNTSSVVSSSPPPSYHNYYPVSPPPSYPPSPTTSVRVTDGGDYLSGSHHPNSLVNSGRSQSQTTGRPALAVNRNRLRSQSSPNIMRNALYSQVPMKTSYSSTTSTTATISNEVRSRPAPLNLVSGELPKTPLELPPTPGMIKIKLVFNDGVYAISTHQDVSFIDLMEKVDKKIRLIQLVKPTDLLRLKYQDEDGDYITINSDDDVQMAFESRGVHSTASLFVSL